MEKILLIDDDEELCELIGEFLTAEGFVVEAAHDGASGLARAKTGAFDLLTLDVMLPEINGFDVLRALRKTSKIPVLMLTARGDDMERIVGLEIGADDYLPKPFNPRELVARIRAVLRRVPTLEESEPKKSGKLQIDDIELSASARSARLSGEELNLTAVEFDLLNALITEAGKIVKKEDLSLNVLDRKLSPFDRSLDMHISNLRKKLGAGAGGEERIKTIRSVGYIYTINN